MAEQVKALPEVAPVAQLTLFDSGWPVTAAVVEPVAVEPLASVTVLLML